MTVKPPADVDQERVTTRRRVGEVLEVGQIPAQVTGEQVAGLGGQVHQFGAGSSAGTPSVNVRVNTGSTLGSSTVASRGSRFSRPTSR
ncbi:hypothetical protein [Kutzneria sp. 744]|uniref:hypothetical protein n=1 Tax=Kutzneria sp. (strain 744) TaxID=345341 RepID=UPI0012FBD2C2|nr:hypothetical protein [Kutzneria sp. 744]